MNLSKSKIKFFNSLKIKKYQQQNSLFLAEGNKIVGEALQSDYDIQTIIASKEWFINHKNSNTSAELIEANELELAKISSLQTPNHVLAIMKIPEFKIDKQAIISSLSLVLDDIQDPGNMGTILRIADWFGIKNVICSMNTVDVYNPKVIQSTMGAFLRVKTHYINLDSLLHGYANLPDFPIFGTYPEGKNIFIEKLSNTGFIIMGNESKGISQSIEPFIRQRLMIPGYPENKQGAESLNVSIAAGIICAEFRRRVK